MRVQTTSNACHTVFSWNEDCNTAVKIPHAGQQENLIPAPESLKVSSRRNPPFEARPKNATSRAATCSAPGHTQCMNCWATNGLPAECTHPAASYAEAQTDLKVPVIASRTGLSVCLQPSARSSAQLECQLETRSLRTAVHGARSPNPDTCPGVCRKDLCRRSHVGKTVLRAPGAPEHRATGLATVIALLHQRSYAS